MRVTTETGDAAGTGSFARDWQALRADESIQFAPLVRPPTPEPPGWWLEFLEFLRRLFSPMVEFLGSIARALGVSAQVLTWGLVALAAVLVLLLLWRYLPRLARRGEDAGAEDTAWSPDASEALALLDHADRLAAEGRYNEATHLLLRRSVGQIAAARPGLLDPSSTAREIASLPALPDDARNAFGTIANRVERSLFALRSLSAEDWRAARAAYADFALAVPEAA